MPIIFILYIYENQNINININILYISTSYQDITSKPKSESESNARIIPHKLTTKYQSISIPVSTLNIRSPHNLLQNPHPHTLPNISSFAPPYPSTSRHIHRIPRHTHNTTVPRPLINYLSFPLFFCKSERPIPSPQVSSPMSKVPKV